MLGKINQVILSTHFLFNATDFMRQSLQDGGIGGRKPFTGEEFERAVNALVEREIAGLCRIAKTRGANSVLFVIRTDTKNHPEMVKKAFESFLAKCRQRFGDRMTELPAWVAYGQDQHGVSPEQKAILEIGHSIRGLDFSGEVRIVRTGEMEGKCEKNANDRFAKALEKEFGIIVPKTRQIAVRPMVTSIKKLSRNIQRARTALRKNPNFRQSKPK